MVKGITQKTIAERLNLHPTTVSMALRNVKLISPETRRRVVQAAKELNYQPNILARNLRNQSSNMIGIIAPSIVWSGVAQARIAATARLAHREHLDLMMYYRWPEEQAYEEAVRSLRCAQVAAIIVSDMSENALPQSLRDWVEEDRPILFLSYHGGESFNTIDTDRVEGFRMATEHLVRLGHRELAIALPEVDGENVLLNRYNQSRVEGFRKGLAEAGLAFRTEQVYAYSESRADSIAEAMHRLNQTSPRPTGLVAYSDEAAALCIQALVRLGVSVPKDISVVGFDDNRLAQTNLIPITTVAQPVEELSKRVVETLVEMVRGQGPRRFAPILCAPKLIVRETTARPPEGVNQ